MYLSEGRKNDCAIAAENNAAFCRIYCQYKDLMYRYAYSILKDHQTAEDIVHDSLICIMEKTGHYAEKDEKAWVMRIVHNQAVNHIKKRSHEVFADRIPRSKPPKKGLFYEIMKLIPDDTDRQIVTLKIDADYRIKEIAEILGLQPNNVSKRYRKTLKYLKKNLKFKEKKS